MNSADRTELEELGWNERFASAFDALGDEELQPGRLAADYGTKFLVQLAGRAPLATLGSALREARLVAVGDWVAVHDTPGATEIRAILPSRSLKCHSLILANSSVLRLRLEKQRVKSVPA